MGREDAAKYHGEVGWHLLLQARSHEAAVHLAVGLDQCSASADLTVLLSVALLRQTEEHGRLTRLFKLLHRILSSLDAPSASRLAHEVNHRTAQNATLKETRGKRQTDYKKALRHLAPALNCLLHASRRSPASMGNTTSSIARNLLALQPAVPEILRDFAL